VKAKKISGGGGGWGARGGVGSVVFTKIEKQDRHRKGEAAMQRVPRSKRKDKEREGGKGEKAIGGNTREKLAGNS